MNEPQRARIRSAAMIGSGIVAMACSFAFLALVVMYLANGAGVQTIGFLVMPGSLLLGWIHVMGFVIAAVLCFALGAGLLALGANPPPGR